jgi:hypothetical protein
MAFRGKEVAVREEESQERESVCKERDRLRFNGEEKGNVWEGEREREIKRCGTERRTIAPHSPIQWHRERERERERERDSKESEGAVRA